MRYNFFDFPHKPFRLMWMEVVGAIGNVNYTDDDALKVLKEQIAFATDVYGHHNRDESEWFGPRLRLLNAEVTERWLSDHEGHIETLASFNAQIQAVCDSANLQERSEKIQALYQFACRYLADDLDHMMSEQTEIMKHFQDAHTDGELREMEAQFLAERISPEYLQSLTPLFLRAGNIDERTFLLSIIKSQAPAEVFAGVVDDLVARVVSPNELAMLKQRLGG